MGYIRATAAGEATQPIRAAEDDAQRVCLDENGDEQPRVRRVRS